ncbi:TonB-dependent receptor [Novosphingobium sp. KACC 22771]|uniref:TonB-dependent receptor n=1 Tax=Novosphingobium sp. KACC 22771 TaxID=3025670 RepID=UPI00236653EF|nr:TonB-dependent receptor [Novosphingobium sp. KACC 22771]WDF74791.1 TonB-dependent receptor [Novosphingobium sp. KACC 22771]
MTILRASLVSPLSRVAKMTMLTTCGASALIVAGAAHAQTAPAAPAADASDGIVVTGFRASLKSALDAKRKDTRVSDGISSEDIGKFPAENITESIQRISGVQMSNINGRGATISIRGLGPQYAMTTINGQTIKSADFTDGFRFDIIQTELASAIQVIKSPTADMDAGGLSGTVNIETTKPLDYHKRQLVVSAKAQNSQYAGGKITPKVGVSYIDQFLDGTLGVYVNLGYQKLNDRADYMWMDRWTRKNIGTDTNILTPRRPRYRRIDRETERLMASGGLQWRPSDRIEVGFNAIYAKDKTTYDVNQQVFLFADDPTKGSVITVNSYANGAASNVTATNFTMENNRQHEDRNLTTQLYTLSSKWTGDNGWSGRAIANYSKGTSYQREAAAILGINIASATLDISNPEAIKFNTSSALNSASTYAPATLTRNEYPNGATRNMRTTEWSGQADLYKEVHFGPFSKLAAGVKFRHETFNRFVSRHDLIALGAAQPAPSSSIFPAMATSNYPVSGFLNNASGIPNAWVAPDLAAYDKALAAAGITVPEIYAPEASYHVDRYMPSVYGQATIDTEIAGMPLRGNIGLRYEYTTQKVQGNVTGPRSDGYSEVQAKIGDYRLNQKYGNLLPSLNLVLEPAKAVQVRFAAAKVLVRPIMDSNTSMAQTSSSSVSGGQRTYSIDLGQAGLKALTANQVDLGVEWYYERSSAIAINGFYKWIKNGTYTSLICPSSFNGTALAKNAAGDCADSAGNAYDITQSLNDPSTIKIKGYEISLNHSFDKMLPVKGFGLIANYTRVIPQKLAVGTGYTVRNLSKVTWNVTPYWENRYFSFRASLNYRSAYDQNSADSFFAREGHTVLARTQVDLSAGYTPDAHLSFTAGVINLNNSREKANYTGTSVWQESSFYGRSFYASASYKF